MEQRASREIATRSASGACGPRRRRTAVAQRARPPRAPSAHDRGRVASVGSMTAAKRFERRARRQRRRTSGGGRSTVSITSRGRLAELVRNPAGHYRRELDEICPFRRSGRDRRRPGTPRRPRPSSIRAARRLHDHVALASARAGRRRCDPQPRPVARGRKRCAAASAAALDRPAGPACAAPTRGEHRERHDLAAEQRDQPADRPADGSVLAVVEPGVPAHALGEGSPRSSPRDHRRQHLAASHGPASCPDEQRELP